MQTIDATFKSAKWRTIDTTKQSTFKAAGCIPYRPAIDSTLCPSFLGTLSTTVKYSEWSTLGFTIFWPILSTNKSAKQSAIRNPF